MYFSFKKGVLNFPPSLPDEGRLFEMYKIVDTLTDSKPWIEHFARRADTTTAWQPNPETSVVILKKKIADQGVDDPGNNIDAVIPVEQVKEQAKAGFIKELREIQQRVPSSSRRRKNQSTAIKSAAKITKRTKDIFAKYKEKHGK